MRTSLFVTLVAFIAVALAGCSAEISPGVDAHVGSDSGTSDVDAFTPEVDAAMSIDGGAIDSGSHDGGSAVDAPSGQDAAVAVDAGPAPTCPAGEHVCPCATGFYCLFMGAACIAPSAPCPPPTP
jgi:hypothetical protein